MWRKELGKGEKMGYKSHRACGRTFAWGSLVSVYGSAQKAEPQWLLDVLTEQEMGKTAVSLCIGDLNWKNPYQRVITND